MTPEVLTAIYGAAGVVAGAGVLWGYTKHRLGSHSMRIGKLEEAHDWHSNRDPEPHRLCVAHKTTLDTVQRILTDAREERKELGKKIDDHREDVIASISELKTAIKKNGAVK